MGCSYLAVHAGRAAAAGDGAPGGAGATASEDAPLVHLFAEPTRRTPEERHRFWVAVETWPGNGERRFLGQMAPHGLPVTWE